jgi:hypothetical protein
MTTTKNTFSFLAVRTADGSLTSIALSSEEADVLADEIDSAKTAPSFFFCGSCAHVNLLHSFGGECLVCNSDCTLEPEEDWDEIWDAAEAADAEEEAAREAEAK